MSLRERPACAACHQQPARTRGLCRPCYGRQWRQGTLPKPPEKSSPRGTILTDAQRRLIESCVPMVQQQAARAARVCPVPLEDLVGAGYEGLIDAAVRFDGRPGVRFSTFAHLAIEHRLAKEIVRSRTHRARTFRAALSLDAPAGIGTLGELILAPEPTPEAHAMASAFATEVRRLAATLPPHHWQMLELRAAGYSVREISRDLGVPLRSVHYGIEAARRRLRQELGEWLS